MPPRHAYWTIIVDGAPTAFRSALPDDLQATFNRLKEKHASATMKWFQAGRLWESKDEAHTKLRDGYRVGKDGELIAPEGRERRDYSWRPGGTHEDPREKYQKAKKAKWDRFKQAIRSKADRRQETPSEEKDVPKTGSERSKWREPRGPRRPSVPKSTEGASPAGRPPRGPLDTPARTREKPAWKPKPVASGNARTPWKPKGPTTPGARPPWKPKGTVPGEQAPWRPKGPATPGARPPWKPKGTVPGEQAPWRPKGGRPTTGEKAPWKPKGAPGPRGAPKEGGWRPNAPGESRAPWKPSGPAPGARAPWKPARPGGDTRGPWKPAPTSGAREKTGWKPKGPPAPGGRAPWPRKGPGGPGGTGGKFNPAGRPEGREPRGTWKPSRPAFKPRPPGPRGSSPAKPKKPRDDD